jgi:hypothetical protein
MMRVEDVRNLLERQCNIAGSQKNWARANSLSPQFICDVLKGRRDPSPRILDALGLELVYRKKVKESTP